MFHRLATDHAYLKMAQLSREKLFAQLKQTPEEHTLQQSLLAGQRDCPEEQDLFQWCKEVDWLIKGELRYRGVC